MPPAPVDVVPALPDLRNVPALSNRPKELPPLTLRLAAFCAWNKAPARLVMIAPANMWMFPAPVQITVPPFSRVRVVRITPFGLLAAIVAPDSMTVRPLPLIVPDVHTKFPRTLNVLLPVRVGVLKPSPRVTSAQSAGVFSVTVALVGMMTVSFDPGARLGDQLLATSQSPLTRLVQMNTMGV